MKLKTFRAASMPQALAQVKRALGADAVIVQTRTVKQGGFLGMGARNVVEITARPHTDSDPPLRPKGRRDAVQRAYGAVGATGTVPRLKTAAPVRPWQEERRAMLRELSLPATNHRWQAAAAENVPTATLLPDPTQVSADMKREMGELRNLIENLVREQRHLHEPQMPEQLFDVYLDLIQREVGEELAREMLQRVQQEMTGNQAANADLIRQRLVEIMDAMVSTAGPICPNLNGKPRVVALIGPTGVGKTTTIAKLAAHFKLRHNKKVGFITIDTYRIGAVEQLRTYAQIIDVPLKVVVSPAELGEAVSMMQDLDYILIDTAGRAQTDTLKIKELRTYLKAAGPDEVHLVLSSTSHYRNLVSAAENFKKLGVDRVIFTKLDEAISFGVVLSVMRRLDAGLSYITTGQDVPDDIEVGNGRRLARLLLGLEGLRQGHPEMAAVS